MALVRDQGQTLVTFGLRRNWDWLICETPAGFSRRTCCMKFVQVRQGCIGEDGIEIKGDGGDSVEVICNDQKPALV